MDAKSYRSAPESDFRSQPSWFNRNVAGMCLASLLSDAGHEMATAVLPLFLSSIGASASALGIIEGASDGIATVAKLAGGRLADLRRVRHGVVSLGYLFTGLATGSFAAATSWLQLLGARTVGWFARGIRGPSRDNILVDSVPFARVGAAFGLERSADTIGAIVGPLVAMLMLHRLGLRGVFLLSLAPGIAAGAAFFVVVREPNTRPPTARGEFPGWRAALTAPFRSFLFAIGVFGIGDFAHSMLVLRAAQLLGPSAKAMSAAVFLYVVHNIAHALMSYPIGSLGDRVERRRLLALCYVVAAAAAAGFAMGPTNVGALASLFVLEGIVMAGQQVLDSAIVTDLLPSEVRGTGFGLLRATAGVGDLVSSVAVGFLWSAISPAAAFSYSAGLSLLGALLLMLTI